MAPACNPHASHQTWALLRAKMSRLAHIWLARQASSAAPAHERGEVPWPKGPADVAQQHQLRLGAPLHLLSRRVVCWRHVHTASQLG